jgi:hypothetical protein
LWQSDPAVGIIHQEGNGNKAKRAKFPSRIQFKSVSSEMPKLSGKSYLYAESDLWFSR